MKLVILKDFENYFTDTVKEHLHLLTNTNIKVIYISAGPYRLYDASYEFLNENEVHFDFYSISRYNPDHYHHVPDLIQAVNESKFKGFNDDMGLPYNDTIKLYSVLSANGKEPELTNEDNMPILQEIV